jgi:hypothetical protein
VISSKATAERNQTKSSDKMNTANQIIITSIEGQSLLRSSYRVSLERHLRYGNANPKDMARVDAVASVENSSHDAACALLLNPAYSARVAQILAA